MGYYAPQWAKTIRGLGKGPKLILLCAAASCIDKTGWLPWSPERLANDAEMTVRSLETHLPRLAKLQLLVRGDGGFRLVAWLSSEKFSESFSVANKEGINPECIGFTLSHTSSQNLKVEASAPAEDANELTNRVQAHFQIPEDLAKAVVYLGLARHYGSGSRERIRSPGFFTRIVDELKPKALPKGYVEYLERKVGEVVNA